jgi:hypothetical protein
MALDIIGAGFGRTGTMSLKFALEQLAYPCYHMVECFPNINDTEAVQGIIRTIMEKGFQAALGYRG